MTTDTFKREQINIRIITMVSEKLGIEERDLSEGLSFRDDLNIDSLDLYELFCEIEKAFLIDIPDEEAERLKTVGALINFVRMRKQT